MYVLFAFSGLQVSIVGLESALNAYIKDTSHTAPFDLKTVPLATTPMQEQVIKAGKPVIETPTPTTKAAAPVAAARQDVYACKYFCIYHF